MVDGSGWEFPQRIAGDSQGFLHALQPEKRLVVDWLIANDRIGQSLGCPLQESPLPADPLRRDIPSSARRNNSSAGIGR